MENLRRGTSIAGLNAPANGKRSGGLSAILIAPKPPVEHRGEDHTVSHLAVQSGAVKGNVVQNDV
jgi:hypothetical protein